MNISKFGVFAFVLLTSLLAGLFFFYHKDINTEIDSIKISNIHSIYDLKQFEQEAKLADKDSLVIFDVSKVIFIKGDPWERGHKKERLNANTINSLHKKGSKLFSTLNRKIRDQLWSIRNSVEHEVLIDEKIVDIINKLQEKSIKTIALTRFLVGKKDQTPPLQQWRINKLFAHGIDFSKSFSFTDPIIFKQFSYEKRYPIFEKGILFTTFATTKDKLLRAFFEKINWYPNKVIMIDDSEANLKMVEQELKTLHIPFIGFEYKAAEKFPAFFDKDIAEFQMKYLLQKKKWLSAKEAAKYLNKQHMMNNQFK